MNTTALIGPSIHIKGEVSAREPLTIAGHVTGTIDVSGHPLTLMDASRVDANIVAHTIVVAGTVNGRLNAEERIVVEQTATVNGDVSAPTLTVHDGAVLQGRLDIAGHSRPVPLKLAV
jgi:cytoskeletal protein CcmA (bactofilin family)